MTRLLVPLAVVLAAAYGLWFLVSPSPQSADQLTAPLLSAEAQEADAEAPEIVEMTMGDAEATVEIVEYASFTCPHCADFHEGPFADLKADYIDTGRVSFTLREVYFDRYGLWAGMVARCGGPERYFGIADMLFAEQSEWVEGEPTQIADNLKRIGLRAGLSEAQVDACLSDGAKAQALVAEFEANAERDGISSTPSFLIDGELYSNMSYAEFQDILDERLQEG